MILDNSRIHHAKLIQPFLEENKDRLELIYLPPYSPRSNRRLLEMVKGKSSIQRILWNSCSNEG